MPPRKKKEEVAEVPATEKADARDARIRQLIESIGGGSLTTLRGEFAHREEVRGAISTGSIAIDHASGVWGMPRGRVIEIFGPEAGGKTTLTLHMIAEVQKAGGIAAFVDAEHALDPIYAAAIGVDVERLLLSQPDSGEDALNVVDALVRSKHVDLIVVDSVAALVPRAELEGQVGDQLPGAQARMMSQALRKISGVLSSSNAVLVFINQVRTKIGISFGNPETTTGGNALKFYASMRLDVRRISSITKSEERIGNRVKVSFVKNKLAPPFRHAEVDIIFGEGISSLGELIDLATGKGILKKSGVWLSHEGENLGAGRENAIRRLREEPERAARIRTELLQQMRA
jgi:recombination protein RecA